MNVAVLATWMTVQSAAAEPETPQVLPSRLELEDARRLQDDQQRVQDELAKAREESLRFARAKEVEELTHDEYEHQREVRSSRRTKAIVLGSVGVVFAAGAFELGQLGKKQNDMIKDGELSITAYKEVARRGRYLNYGAYGCIGLSVIFIGTAIPLYLLNLDPGEYQVHATAGDGVKGLSISGSF